MFESLGYEKEDKYHVTYTSKSDNHKTFSFYKENLPVYKFEIVLTGITGAFELQMEELEKQKGE